MSLSESIAVIFSFLSVVLAIKKDILNWTIGIIGIAFYGVIFYQEHLYSNLTLQFVYLIQSIWGLIEWKRNEKKINKSIDVTKIKWSSKFILNSLLFLFPSTFLLCWIFSSSKYFVVDAITTTISIYAYYLLMKGKIENWIFWLLVDVLYVYMFIEDKLYLSLTLYLFFIYLCIRGLIKWNKN